MENQYDYLNLMKAGGYNPLDGGITTNQMQDFRLQGLLNNIGQTNKDINALNLPPLQEPNLQAELLKKQQKANMLLALGDLLGGRDATTGFTQRQSMFDAQKKAAEKKAKQEKLEKDREAFIKNNPDLAGAIRMNQLFGFNPPPAKDRRIVLQNGVQYYADTKQPVIPNAPGKTKTTKQEYDDLAAKIKIEIANNGRVNNPNLTKSQLDFYDDYIKTGSINYLNKSIANLISGTTGGQSNSTKNYTVTNNSYGSMSANEIINQAMQLNPGATREGVIKNLIANKIISE